MWRVSMTPALTTGKSGLAPQAYKSTLRRTLAAEASPVETWSLCERAALVTQPNAGFVHRIAQPRTCD